MSIQLARWENRGVEGAKRVVMGRGMEIKADDCCTTAARMAHCNSDILHAICTRAKVQDKVVSPNPCEFSDISI